MCRAKSSVHTCWRTTTTHLSRLRNQAPESMSHCRAKHSIRSQQFSCSRRSSFCKQSSSQLRTRQNRTMRNGPQSEIQMKTSTSCKSAFSKQIRAIALFLSGASIRCSLSSHCIGAVCGRGREQPGFRYGSGDQPASGGGCRQADPDANGSRTCEANMGIAPGELQGSGLVQRQRNSASSCTLASSRCRPTATSGTRSSCMRAETTAF